MPNHLVGTPNGGMTVYYIPGIPPFDQEITAFAPVGPFKSNKTLYFDC